MVCTADAHSMYNNSKVGRNDGAIGFVFCECLSVLFKRMSAGPREGSSVGDTQSTYAVSVDEAQLLLL